MTEKRHFRAVRVLRVEAMRAPVKLHLQCGHMVVQAERKYTSNSYVYCPYCPPAQGHVTMTLPQSRRLCASLDGVTVELDRRRHAILEFLLLRRPWGATVEEIRQEIWGLFGDPDTAVNLIHGSYIGSLKALGFPIEYKRGSTANLGRYKI